MACVKPQILETYLEPSEASTLISWWVGFVQLPIGQLDTDLDQCIRRHAMWFDHFLSKTWPTKQYTNEVLDQGCTPVAGPRKWLYSAKTSTIFWKKIIHLTKITGFVKPLQSLQLRTVRPVWTLKFSHICITLVKFAGIKWNRSPERFLRQKLKTILTFIAKGHHVKVTN